MEGSWDVGREQAVLPANVVVSTETYHGPGIVRFFTPVDPRKDYIIKHAYVEFISPSGDTQIGINPRFNEQDDDEFRLQAVGVVVAYHG